MKAYFVSCFLCGTGDGFHVFDGLGFHGWKEGGVMGGGSHFFDAFENPAEMALLLLLLSHLHRRQFWYGLRISLRSLG